MIMLLLLPITLNAQELSIKQQQYVMVYSKAYFGRHWKQWNRVLRAIRVTECSKEVCKKSQKKGDNSYGNWQIQLSTAKDMMSQLNYKWSDEQIIHELIYNDNFSTHVAVLYCVWLFKQLNDLDLTIISYNLGIGKVIKLLRSGQPLPSAYLHKVKGVTNDKTN